MLIMAPMGPGTYGSQMGRPPKKKKPMARKPEEQKRNLLQQQSQVRQLKLNMQKMPPAVQKRLKAAMRKKK